MTTVKSLKSKNRKLDYDLEQADFGCINHSDYGEVKDE